MTTKPSEKYLHTTMFLDKRDVLVWKEYVRIICESLNTFVDSKEDEQIENLCTLEPMATLSFELLQKMTEKTKEN